MYVFSSDIYKLDKFLFRDRMYR